MTKILVIEDEQLIRANITEILQLEDFRTIEAENGLLGVQLALEQLPDLIICDIMMPELDGYDVLNLLRQDLTTAAIPFIFISAKASKADLRQGMELGADDYLTKPFTADELISAISTRLMKQAAIAQRYITELQQVEEKLNYLIHYDSLTKLPNQLLLGEQLKQVLAQANSSDQLIPILTLSLNRLSQINSTLGPATSDLLLKAVAQRLVACVGADSVVTRLQGDRFAIILTMIDQRQEAVNIAQTILDSLSQPFLLDGHEVCIVTNIGMAFYPDAGCDIDTLINNADLARDIATKREDNSYHLYTAKISAEFSNQLVLESSLRHALERAEFEVYYQPQVELQTGQIVGAEALLRWQHPERGIVSPVEFIPLAEQNGLIIPIGEWVLTTACSQIKLWQAAGFPSLRIAVNLSGRQFSQPNLGQRLVQIFEDTGLAPKHVELELSESILVKNPQAAFHTLNELKALGVQIAIDDFGTGYSSLSYLKQFSFGTLKIDQDFVRNISGDAKNAAITTAIIQMAHSLNLKVVAEGVETAAELSFLYQQHCNEMQGYLFSRPLPAKEFERLLTTGKQLPIQPRIKTTEEILSSLDQVYLSAT